MTTTVTCYGPTEQFLPNRICTWKELLKNQVNMVLGARNKKPMNVLFLGKRDSCVVDAAEKLTRQIWPEASVVLGASSLNVYALGDTWDLILSVLYPGVVPECLLERSTLSLNWHPASPEYPGIGCTNWAIYEGATEYGVTCHLMAPKVDTGRIIAVDRFSILPNDTVESLTERAHATLLSQFYRVVGDLVSGRRLPASEIMWRTTSTTTP